MNIDTQEYLDALESHAVFGSMPDGNFFVNFFCKCADMGNHKFAKPTDANLLNSFIDSLEQIEQTIAT